MKILQVNKYYAPVVGGVETVCKQYSEHLAKDHEVTVLCVNKTFTARNSVEVIGGAKVLRCRSWGSFFSMPISLTFIFHFICLSLKSNIIFVHLPCPLIDFALLLTPIRKQKLILVWHSDIVRQKVLKRILHPLLLNSLRKANTILTTSPNLMLHSQYLYQFESKCEILPLSIDCNDISLLLLKGAETKAIKHISGFDCLFLGRISSYKGINELLEALLILKERAVEPPHVVIAGDGELSHVVLEFIKENKLENVMFINCFINEFEKYALMQKAKCFLFPSTESSEAFGITQLEAMYLKTPVINTNLKSGVPWVSIHGETGITIPPKDSIALADAIEKILSDTSLLNTLSENAHQRVLSYFDDKIAMSKLNRLLKL